MTSLPAVPNPDIQEFRGFGGVPFAIRNRATQQRASGLSLPFVEYAPEFAVPANPRIEFQLGQHPTTQFPFEQKQFSTALPDEWALRCGRCERMSHRLCTGSIETGAFGRMTVAGTGS